MRLTVSKHGSKPGINTGKHEVHGPNHQDDKVDINKHVEDDNANADSSENGTNVPDFDGATPGVLAHDDFQVVHGYGSCDDQKEIGNEKGTSTILETQVWKPENDINQV